VYGTFAVVMAVGAMMSGYAMSMCKPGSGGHRSVVQRHAGGDRHHREEHQPDPSVPGKRCRVPNHVG